MIDLPDVSLLALHCLFSTGGRMKSLIKIQVKSCSCAQPIAKNFLSLSVKAKVLTFSGWNSFLFHT